jgi:hypothetical protein
VDHAGLMPVYQHFKLSKIEAIAPNMNVRRFQSVFFVLI